MRGTTTTARARSSGWAGYAAAAWALVFAARGVYWALGGTVGLGTLSPGIQRAAANHDPGIFAALWTSVALELFAAALALALVRPWGRAIPGWLLLLPTWGAGTLLAGHGGLFVGFGALAATGAYALTPEVRWYSLFWGPWFVLGGVLFMAAGLAYLRGSPDRRVGTVASALGALGGLAVTAAPFVLSALAGAAG